MWWYLNFYNHILMLVYVIHEASKWNVLIPFNCDDVFWEPLAAGKSTWRRWAKTRLVRWRKSPAIHFTLSLTQTHEVEGRPEQCKWPCVKKISWIQHRKDFLSEVSHYPGNRFHSLWETVICLNQVFQNNSVWRRTLLFQGWEQTYRSAIIKSRCAKRKSVVHMVLFFFSISFVSRWCRCSWK